MYIYKFIIFLGKITEPIYDITSISLPIQMFLKTSLSETLDIIFLNSKCHTLHRSTLYHEETYTNNRDVYARCQLLFKVPRIYLIFP